MTSRLRVLERRRVPWLLAALLTSLVAGGHVHAQPKKLPKVRYVVDFGSDSDKVVTVLRNCCAAGGKAVDIRETSPQVKSYSACPDGVQPCEFLRVNRSRPNEYKLVNEIYPVDPNHVPLMDGFKPFKSTDATTRFEDMMTNLKSIITCHDKVEHEGWEHSPTGETICDKCYSGAKINAPKLPGGP